MKVEAEISDYNRRPFNVTGELRLNAKSDMYVIDQGKEGTRIFPLGRRIVRVYAEGEMILETHNEKVTFRNPCVLKLKGGE